MVLRAMLLTPMVPEIPSGVDSYIKSIRSENDRKNFP